MLNTVAKRMRHFCSHLRTKEMLDDVEDDVWWKSNFAQHHPTSCNMVAKWVQHVGWCCINMLHTITVIVIENELYARFINYHNLLNKWNKLQLINNSCFYFELCALLIMHSLTLDDLTRESLWKPANQRELEHRDTCLLNLTFVFCSRTR